MSPNLKPLLLPQLVEERKKMEVHHHTYSEDELAYTYHTTNSSSSDIATPLTPTFSHKGHYRTSSSTSSVDLTYLQNLESPASPTQQSKHSSTRQLPDVQEEPIEREDTREAFHDHFGLYSCLCDAPCEHRTSSEHAFPGDIIADHDIDYDWDCLSDGDSSINLAYSKKRVATELPFLGLTSRLGSRLPSQSRWKLSRRGTLRSAATTEVSLENALSRATTSSRSSSVSSPNQRISDRLQDLPRLEMSPASCYESRRQSVDSFDALDDGDMDEDQKVSLERDRAKATTPLLPPLMTGIFPSPPKESPLQSPTIEPSPVASEVFSPPSCTTNFSRPSLSAKPSVSSLRHLPHAPEIPAVLPAILQEYDDWSDRLGHANFTITPQPYELDKVDSDTITKYRLDWDAARVNYTKHLVRTGENYGQTSKIYGLTEAKWAETEAQWRSTYETAMKQYAGPTAPRQRATTISSRSRSRGRTRGRSDSAGAVLWGRPAPDQLFAEEEWRRVEDALPSAIPQILDADGKFPSRGDEDIVGPMHRAEPMSRTHSEEKYGSRFWKSLAGRVGLRK